MKTGARNSSKTTSMTKKIVIAIAMICVAVWMVLLVKLLLTGSPTGG